MTSAREAANLLVDELLECQELGWFQAFIDALKHEGILFHVTLVHHVRCFNFILAAVRVDLASPCWLKWFNCHSVCLSVSRSVYIFLLYIR